MTDETSPVDTVSQRDLPPLPTEQLMMRELPSLGGVRGLVISPGRAQMASHLLDTQQFQTVDAWYVDLHNATSATQYCPESVEVLCGADLPDAAYDLVAMPVLKRSEAEMTRDLLQQAHARLVPGGYLTTSVDNPKDTWLHEQMQALFDKVTSCRTPDGCVYWGRKTNELKKVKDFDCQFVFRDEDERMIQVVSRPSVFSHRRLDPGARQLMLAADIGEADNVLDMGCGSGAISMAAAFRTTGQVFGVDANARAVECLAKGAELNELANVTPVWNADGVLDLPVPIDLALANPPYFGDDNISRHFVDTCYASLRPLGALLVVTKSPSWYEAYFQQLFEDIVIFESSRYFVACGRKPSD